MTDEAPPIIAPGIKRVQLTPKREPSTIIIRTVVPASDSSFEDVLDFLAAQSCGHERET
jgi:hypothetical protein